MLGEVDNDLRNTLGIDVVGQAVTTEEQIIVAEDITQEENDKQQLHPMLEQTEANREAVGIKEKTAAAGRADTGWLVADEVDGTETSDRAWPSIV